MEVLRVVPDLATGLLQLSSGIPIVGPFIGILQSQASPFTSARDNGRKLWVNSAALLSQAGGIALMVTGAVNGSINQRHAHIQLKGISATPTSNGAQLSLSGSF